MTDYTDERKISSVQTDTAIFYPDTDGKPMAASELHRDILNRTIDILKAHYAKQPDVHVSGDLLMYYVEGDPRQVVAPDVFVSFGLDKKRRATYLVWVEGKLPEFVMEFSSKTTYEDDLDKKMNLYASLGVQDYFLYDAEGLFLPSQLMGYTLVEGKYVPVMGNRDGGLHSDVLNLDFYVDDEGLELDDVHLELDDVFLRIYDPVARRWLQTAAEARAEQEAARAEQEAARADAEKTRADTEKTRADTEKTRADNAETEIAKLREQLECLQNPL